MKKCFIITPIGDDNSEIRRHIDGVIDLAIRPALEEYDILVAHRICEIGSITKQIIREMCTSDLIIANLSEKNPNVMYELAVCHCMQKPVIQIMEKTDDSLPFDIIEQRTIQYQNDPLGMKELCFKIKEWVSHVNDYSQENPIYDCLNSLKITEQLNTALDLESGQQKSVYSLMQEYLIHIEDKIDTLIFSSPKGYQKRIGEIRYIVYCKDSIQSILKKIELITYEFNEIHNTKILGDVILNKNSLSIKIINSYVIKPLKLAVYLQELFQLFAVPIYIEKIELGDFKD